MSDIQDYSNLLKSRGLEEVKAELDWDAKSDGVENIFYWLLTPAGTTIFTTDMSAWKEVDGNVALLEKSMESDGAAGETLKLRGHEYKTYVAYGRGLARKLSSSLGRQWRT